MAWIARFYPAAASWVFSVASVPARHHNEPVFVFWDAALRLPPNLANF
jgi:hypothetical protein